LVEEEKPDVLVVATGGIPLMPEIPGVERKNVFLAVDVLSGKAEVGERVAVIGGAEIGMEVALYLAEKGKKVCVIEKEPQTLPDTNTATRLYLLWMAAEQGVEMLTDSNVVEIREGAVVVDRGGESREVETDSVVVAAGYVPNRELSDKLKGLPIRVYEIGDCQGIGRIKGAIHGASIISRAI
jgi:2-enoate reductase